MLLDPALKVMELQGGVRCKKRYIVREIYRALCATPDLVPAV